MNKLFYFIVLIFGIHFSISAQSKVEFSVNPPMELNTKINSIECSVYYEASVKSTIYIEFIKNNTIIGTGIYTIDSKDKATKKINIPILKKGLFKSGNNYSYQLHMYEGGKYDWSKKACKSKVIKNVRVKEQRPNKADYKTSIRNFFN